jgi:NAD(P)-dependent dehydrogenase (short-subunit alcohol dehydrogenase family)
VLTWRTSFPVISFCERDDLDVVSQIGCITPDHAIRTKPRPLVLRIEDADDLGSSRIQIETKIASYAAAYREYFRRSTQARGVVRKELDPFPRVFLFQDLGLLAAGRTWKEAEIVADIYEHTASVIDWATSMGRYEPVGELDLFDVEYWSLEQAKLGKPAAAGLLDRKIVLVTGAASGIGFATASAMLAAGAHVVLTDRDVGQLDKAVLTLSATYSDRVWSCLCDVSAPATVARAVRQTCMRFGGLDVVVSNAGAAFSGGLHTDAGDSALKASFEVNLMGHQNVAKAAASVMLAQNSGGVLLFNASKSAFSPGPDFGPYAVPKAALVALMRQYAVDLAPFGIRSNAVNADRIRTDLFGGGVLEARARARGVDVDEYFKGNLLRRETTGEDVAQAFVFLATAQATTGCVVTVDGGNPAAFPR